MQTAESIGIAELPLEAYRSCDSMRYNHTLPHFHDRAELVAVTRGTVRCVAWGLEACCAAGEVAAINPGALHALTPERDAVYAGVLFRYETLEPRTPDACHSRYIEPYQRGERLLPLRLSGPAGGRLCEEIDRAAAASLSGKPGYELELKACVYQLMAVLVEFDHAGDGINYAGNHQLDADSPLRRSLDFINAHYGQKIYLEQLAGIANMNKNYFCEYFKSRTGYTPVEYLNIVRIGEAGKLIRCTRRKLSDIAFDVGFNNLSYFTQTFLSVTGILPSKYRESAEE